VLERIQGVTSAQVQMVAKRYLIDAGLTIAVLDPQLRQKQLRSTATVGKRHLGETVKSQ
jgi:predicted Zn-dependent peptidase